MDQFAVRRYFVGGVIILIAVIFIIKLFILQVIDTSYKSSAESNTHRHITQYPARGLIYDRKGELLVYNQAAYDIMIRPYMLKEFDTLEFISIIDISKDELKKKIQAAKEFSYYKSSVFLEQLSSESYALLQEKLYKYPGFFVQTRTLRKYSSPIAAHVLGYVGEVDKITVAEKGYYKMGDYIGISGVEKTCEEELRGEKGVKIFLVDVHNRIKGSYLDGKADRTPKVGKDITLTLDADLQSYGEKLMANKWGAIVAIEPLTGEILALVTTPSYPPDLLVGRQRTANYRKLKQDTLNPLFNRAIMAKYPPGSTFKVVNAAIALQEKTLKENTELFSRGAFVSGNVIVKCHNYRSPLNVKEAIQYSSNNFFCRTFRGVLEYQGRKNFENRFNNWRDHVQSFGFGSKLTTDFSHELPGFIPSVEYYDRYYGKGHWASLTIISLAIGQGEIGTTPLQLANMAAAIANRGYYYKPHIIKKIENRDVPDESVYEKNYTSIDSANLEIVIEGMSGVVNGGPGSTARWIGLKDIEICGKTGTAENPHGEDHSVFTAFAPRENPQIAIAVYVENGGAGSVWAAPIASLMIEHYLTGTTKRKWIENRVINRLIEPAGEKKD